MEKNISDVPSLEYYAIGQQIFEPLLSELKEVKGDRTFLQCEDGIIKCFTVLKGITYSEIEDLNGDISIILNDFKIPILTLSYNKSKFDMPITNFLPHFLPPDSCTLIHFLIEEKGYILKNFRLFGLEPKLAYGIMDAIEKTKHMNIYETLNGLNEIYSNVPQKDIEKTGIGQHFNKI